MQKSSPEGYIQGSALCSALPSLSPGPQLSFLLLVSRAKPLIPPTGWAWPQMLQAELVHILCLRKPCFLKSRPCLREGQWGSHSCIVCIRKDTQQELPSQGVTSLVSRVIVQKSHKGSALSAKKRGPVMVAKPPSWCATSGPYCYTPS